MYVYGVDSGTNVLNNYSTSISTSTGLATWASSSYTEQQFVNNSGLLYPTACTATGNSGASPESNNRIIVTCSDNASPVHYWANIYAGTSYWATTTTWYDQGAPGFYINGVDEYASTRPAVGFFEDYAASTNWMILGELDPFTSLGITYTSFVESDYTTSWSSWAQRYW